VILVYVSGLRYYSPSLGRWVSLDPMGEKDGDNLLCFLLNNPLTRVDPFGLASWEACKASAKFSIKINKQAEEGGRGNIDAVITIYLNRDDCDCICEHPTLKQRARYGMLRVDLFWSDTEYGHYCINRDWFDDPIVHAVMWL